MSDTLPPLPDFSPSFRPRWLSDNGGFTADQMRAYASSAVTAVEAECFRLRASYEYSEAHAARLMAERDSAVAAERERCACIAESWCGSRVVSVRSGPSIGEAIRAET
jgi:hypothetical protein